MKHLQCPDKPSFKDISENPMLFLAGGITGCPDWQEKMLELLTPAKKLLVANPRRAHFDVSNKNMSVDQIKWEKTRLDSSDMILFWFPKETVCPITLFELGYRLGRHQWSATHKTLFVGCHPEYSRRLDVETQISLTPWSKSIKLVNSIEDLAKQVLDRCVCCYQNGK